MFNGESVSGPFTRKLLTKARLVVEGEVVADLTPYRAAFLLMLIIGGQVGLTLLVLTLLLWKGIQRHPTLINFCITWIIYSTVYCLL